MNSKTTAQEAALQMVYALELGGQDQAAIEAWYAQAHPLEPAMRVAATGLLSRVAANQARMEELISRHAKGWRLQRMSVIDRSLVKLAIAEMLADSPPPFAVVARETLALAKKFSQPSALGFLHGLLDAIAQELRS